MALTVAITNRVMDECCRYAERLYSVDAASGYGMGVSPADNLAAGAIDDLKAYILATADEDVIEYLLTAANRIQDVSSAWLFVARRFSHLWAKLESLIRLLDITNVTSLETYLAYYNTGAGGTWTALMPPAWRDLHYKWKGAYPHLTNVYWEIVQGGVFRGTTYTNALFKLDVTGAGAGTSTNGAAVDYTKYCGGVGKLNVSGLAGSGNVTVTGIGVNPATRAVTASVTWITSVSGDGLTTMVVGAGTAPADCLLVDVTAVAVAAGITNGDIYVECHKPASRLAVPF